MATRISVFALAVPAAVLALLLAVPELDKPWGTFSFHFYVVSAASLLAAGACAVLVLSARSIRETRVLFLALCFFSLGMVFSVHGLTTPGFIFNEPYAALGRSPWVSTLAAGLFAAMSVVSIPGFMERVRLRLPEITLVVCVVAIVAYFVVSLLFPSWLTGFPTQEEWFQHLLTAVTVGLLAFAAWRYFQSYLFARLPGQLAVMVGLAFLAEAQLSLDFGRFWAYSWWMYHGLFLCAFASVLLGWSWEIIRARNARAIGEAIAMRDALAQLNRGRPTPVVALADQIENHDPATFRHVDRVAAYAYAIGQRIGFGPARLRQLVLAAQMHDIGKIGLPSYILSKPGKLSEQEWALVREHPAKGWEIARRMKAMGEMAKVIRHHHERFDGSGYPDGVAGDQIPLDARVISVADTFDALTSERPYRPAMTLDDAREELERVAGSQLDPACVKALLDALDSGGLAPRLEAAPAELLEGAAQG